MPSDFDMDHIGKLAIFDIEGKQLLKANNWQNSSMMLFIQKEIISKQLLELKK